MNKSLQKLQIISEDGQVDLRYFINFALKGMISWTVLDIFLDDLTPDLSKSKNLNKILLQQLQVLQDRVNISNPGIMEPEYEANGYVDELEMPAAMPIPHTQQSAFQC